MKTVAISNQKGGVCKTTTASVLSDGLVERGFKVLRIDMDPQCDFSCLFYIPEDIPDIMDFLEGNKAAIYEIGEGSHIIPGSPKLSYLDSNFADSEKFYMLKEAIQGIKADFDYIIIDCPPSYGTLTINALVSADEVIVPLFADRFAVKGLNQLYDIFIKTKTCFNPDLMLHGALITRFEKRTVLHRQVAAQLTEALEGIGSKVFRNKIRSSITISEMQARNLSFSEVKKENNINGAVVDYENFIDEFLEDEKNE